MCDELKICNESDIDIPYIAFLDNGKEIGRFFRNGDKIDFKGDVTTSAQLFITEIIQQYLEHK